MPIEIEEVLRRSEQGATAPYICRGTNDKLYYVKGRGAGYDSLVKEWIAGNLARRFGLPIAPFDLVYVPRELYEAGRSGNLRDLGFGLLFGSEEIPNSHELTVLNAGSLPAELKQDIAAFDWWVKNGDRTLSQAGGNPNILWSESTKRPAIIDHNLAFDEGVTLRSQLTSHIFASALEEVCEGVDLQAHYNEKFKEALSDLLKIIDDIPPRWHYVDDAETIKISFSLKDVEAVLRRYEVQAFWKRK
ncbi:hypothetical protein RJJ65_33115 [Rhizobium hidalgonense]|uniref:HipA-like kinase domain-containing protein n=1 Tax=Rhizobium hidalgonense TaxID=1538159 RepID=A0AAJ2LPV5_9HYPH|nr:HipA family kinase [Rhizobium hidalgonense]MDR9777393.1 hypothetical protein [Rhizobium hidalgonense]MDR9823740.1 hypothetical protein [Rhizobium hidalgonense]